MLQMKSMAGKMNRLSTVIMKKLVSLGLEITWALLFLALRIAVNRGIQPRRQNPAPISGETAYQPIA
jgi:hypothetical protein